MNGSGVWPDESQWHRGADGGLSRCAKPYLEWERCVLDKDTDNSLNCVELHRIYKECRVPRFTHAARSGMLERVEKELTRSADDHHHE